MTASAPHPESFPPDFPSGGTDLLDRCARSVRSLAPAVSGTSFLRHMVEARHAEERGYFRPGEDERLRLRFGQYLTARAGFLQTIAELRPIARAPERSIDEEARLRAFIIGYAAACLLVRAGRFLVEHAEAGRTVRAKLDEAAPELGIPRKQFTHVYRSLTSPRNAWHLLDAMRFADARRGEIESLSDDPQLAEIVAWMKDAEDALRIGARQYFRMRLRYRLYSMRRRRISALRKAMFAVMEGSGRVIADLRNPFHRKRVTPEIIAQLTDLLEPGDVVITRHDDAMSNLFLPGFWPHAALHLGSPTRRAQLGIEIDADRARRWVEPNRVLEARKDGVLLRPLAETLRVDSFAVIRPHLGRQQMARALGRALSHEGKLYDFEFDFTRADRLVCTEVVYRAFDGIGPIKFQPKRRAGRVTVSAEDLLDLAIEGNLFRPVAVFGVPGGRGRLVTGELVTSVLAGSYQ